MQCMSASLKLDLEIDQLRQKPPLGQKRPKPQLGFLRLEDLYGKNQNEHELHSMVSQMVSNAVSHTANVWHTIIVQSEMESSPSHGGMMMGRSRPGAELAWIDSTTMIPGYSILLMMCARTGRYRHNR